MRVVYAYTTIHMYVHIIISYIHRHPPIHPTFSFLFNAHHFYFFLLIYFPTKHSSLATNLPWIVRHLLALGVKGIVTPKASMHPHKCCTLLGRTCATTHLSIARSLALHSRARNVSMRLISLMLLLSPLLVITCVLYVHSLPCCSASMTSQEYARRAWKSDHATKGPLSPGNTVLMWLLCVVFHRRCTRNQHVNILPTSMCIECKVLFACLCNNVH